MTNPMPRESDGVHATKAASLPRWMLMSAVQKLTIALLAALCGALLTRAVVSVEVGMLLAWNAGAWVYIFFSVALILHADARATRGHVRDQDQSGRALFLLILSATCISVFAIGFLVGSASDLPFWPKVWRLGLSVTALLSSWALIQLLFAFHYARLYYLGPLRPDQGLHEGLAFPGDKLPDYLDFAYHAFAVGISGATSDVNTTSRTLRRLTLVHGMLAFIFNMIILALSINIVAGLV